MSIATSHQCSAAAVSECCLQFHKYNIKPKSVKQQQKATYTCIFECFFFTILFSMTFHVFMYTLYVENIPNRNLAILYAFMNKIEKIHKILNILCSSTNRALIYNVIVHATFFFLSFEQRNYLHRMSHQNKTDNNSQSNCKIFFLFFPPYFI